MSGETRAEVLDRVAANAATGQRPMYREILGLFFEKVLGPDDEGPITLEQKLLVVAALQEQRDRFLAEAGFESVEAMEAAR